MVSVDAHQSTHMKVYVLNEVTAASSVNNDF